MVITIRDIESARERGRSVVVETPLLPSTSFSRLSGADVYFKAENLQRTGSFKIRGAMNALSLLPDGAKAGGVVAASAGNHAQGVALAARELGIGATVFMPESAAIPKIAATKAYGANVHLAGAHLAEAVDHAHRFADAEGATFIHPYDDPGIVAGQGTIGLEIAAQLPSVANLIVPVGGGGLISGTAIAVRQAAPDVRIIGVQAEAVPTYVLARDSGRPVEIEGRATVSDGIAVSRPSEMCFDIIEELVDDLVLIDDDRATEAVALLLEREKLLVEPSGAVSAAALMSGKLDLADGPSVAVLSGGNIDLLLLDDLVRHGLATRGRFAAMSVLVPDLPGNLAVLLTEIGRAGGNILSVEHHREEIGIPFGKVEIRLTMETRSAEHSNAIVTALSDYELVIHPGSTKGVSG